MCSLIVSLDENSVGCKCVVCSILAKDDDRRRILDLGIVTGTEIEVLENSPAGDPVAYLIRGAVIALRKDDAKMIIVKRQARTKTF